MLSYRTKHVLILYVWVAFICMAMQSYAVYAQPFTLADSIQHKLDLYGRAHPSAQLFAHFDKTIYTNNENVWFTAYLLNCARPQLHNTLSVSLVNDIDHAVVLKEKFAMSVGIGFGNLHLPDSVAPGNYTFMVYTNRVFNNKPEAFFTQPVTIKTTASPGFKAVLSVADTSSRHSPAARQVMLSVNGTDYLPVANAAVSYTLSGADTAVITGKAKTDKAGQYAIQVPRGKNIVKVQIAKNNTSQYVYLALPTINEQARVNFYPEGGNLVNNLPARVGWEVTTGNGSPLRTTGLLYENNTVIDTVTTNEYGMGRFALLPKPGYIYKVLLHGVNQKDTVYRLPTAIPAGMAVTLYQAVVNDTLQLQLRSSYSGLCYLHVHNYRNEFFCVPVPLNPVTPRRVKIALQTLPKGVAQITLTDSLGRPYAERLFFAHHNQHDALKLETDKKVYAPRQKVKLSIGLDDKDGRAVQAAVSIACVQDNRIELKKANDIESYFYLKSALTSMPLKDNYLGNSDADKGFLEQVLLIKGWRRYTWADVLQANRADSAVNQIAEDLTGTVTEAGKPVKKPVSLLMWRDSVSSIIETDYKGRFTLSYNQLLSRQDKPLLFMLGTGHNYTVHVPDPYQAVTRFLAAALPGQTYEQALSSLYTDNFAVKGLEKAIQLNEVKVSARKDNSLYGIAKQTPGPNACGDWVCVNNILNCSNHPTGTQPIPGRSYSYRGGITIYAGCKLSDEVSKPLVTIPGIYLAKEYYGADYSVTNPTQPEYFSTIFWRHLVKVVPGKKTEVSFYTSDITGDFRIVVQGITTNGVAYADTRLTVKK